MSQATYLRRMFAAVPEWERENERLALTVKCPFCTCYAPAGEPCRNFVRLPRSVCACASPLDSGQWADG